MADLRKLALQRKLDAAEAAGDTERAEQYRARIDGAETAGTEASDDVVDYEADGWSKDELQAEADKRGLTVTGTGENSRVLKADLVKALQDNDAAGG